MKKVNFLKNAALIAGLLAVLLTRAPMAPAQPDAIYGAEQYFTLDWQAAERHGRPVVAGTLVNNFGLQARNVRLRVEAFDAAGQVTSTTTGYLPSEAPPGSHVYFEIPVPARASAYRVTVRSFEWVLGHG